MNENQNSELQHHGVLGMKWGVRRYQKKDGSLTPAGKKRYASELDDKKKAYDTAKKARTTASINKTIAKGNYDDAFKRAYNYSSAHPVSQYVGKSQKQISNALWKDSKKKANEYTNAKEASKKASENVKKAKSEYKNAKTNAKYEKYGLNPKNANHIANVQTFGYRGAQRIQNRINNKHMSDFKSSMIEVGRTAATTALLTVGTISAMSLAAKYSKPTSQVLDSTGKVLKRFYD